MKFSILQENIKQGLSIVSHIAGKNINLPILNNVMIEAKDGNIKLITTDLELGVVNKIRGKIEEDGVYTVNAKILFDYVSILPNKKVEVEQKDNNLLIRASNYKTKITGQSSEEFPLIPKIEKGEAYLVSAKELKKAISQVVFSVSTSGARIELSGVLFIFNGNKLILAATDSYRLTEKEVSVKSQNKEEKKVIIPAKTLQELLRILSAEREINGADEDLEDIKIYLSENQILFSFGSTDLISRLIEGQYPDYKQIIPQNSKTKVVISKEELLRAVKASSLFAKAGINDINLDFPKNKNQVVVSSASGQVGENITELEALVSGEDNGMVVNYRYLLDGLNNIESENIAIEIIDNNTPCILKPEKEDGYLYIIMPIKQ